jgi:hypothetical protein
VLSIDTDAAALSQFVDREGLCPGAGDHLETAVNIARSRGCWMSEIGGGSGHILENVNDHESRNVPHSGPNGLYSDIALFTFGRHRAGVTVPSELRHQA